MDFVEGRLVRSKAGRDKTRTYAVMAVDGQMLLLADGSLRGIAHPKRKKRRHVATTAIVLGNALLQSDQQLSGAIAAYNAAHPV
ncbi:MAG: KOW domain-containing RNA-binding protein [Gemmiger sp.]|nr:KOW domain-containing RNA-binding protein [Gemmiger sp.]